MMNIQGVVFTILVVIAVGFAQTNNTNLVCYDCDPKQNREQCAQPAGSGVPQVSCNQGTSAGDTNTTFVCVSAYLTLSGERANETGIYRDCRSYNSSVVNYCDLLNEEVTGQNIVLTSCVTCNTSRCNNVTFNSDGSPNSSPLIQTALTLLGISALFILFF